MWYFFFFFFQAEDGIRDHCVTGVQTCALPISLSSVCPHLGCSIAWHDDKNKFICPCHNGQFTAEGKLLGGPPPRGMDRLESKVEDGKLVVHYQTFKQLVPNKEVIA